MTFHSSKFSIALTCFRFVLYFVVMALCGCKVKLQEETDLVIAPERIRVTNDSWPKRDIAWSPDGTRLAYAVERVQTELYAYSLTQKREIGKWGEVFDQFVPAGRVTLSPNGQTLAYFSLLRSRKLWLYNVHEKTEKALALGNRYASDPAWSFDGQWLAYSAYDTVEQKWGIWTIRANGEDSRRIALPPQFHAFAPTWSPDGTRLAFRALDLTSSNGGRELWIVSLPEGSIQKLTSSQPGDVWPAWSPDGATIAFSAVRNDTTGVWIISVDDGQQQKLTASFDYANRPTWSPDGSALAFRIYSGFGIYEIATKKATRYLANANFDPLWLPESNTLLTRQAGYVVNQLGVLELENSKTGFPILELGYPGDGEPSWSADNNTLAFTRARGGMKRILTLTLATGESRPFHANIPGESFFQNPAISTDGSRLAWDNGKDIFMSFLDGSASRKLAVDLDEPLTQPSWSPDNKQLACRSPQGLHILNIADNELEPQVFLPGTYLNPGWSTAHPVLGSHIAFERSEGIFIFSAEEQQPVLVIPGGRYPCWAPDGTRLAYVFGNEIYTSKVLVPFTD